MIRTHAANDAYRSGWDAVFGRKEPAAQETDAAMQRYHAAWQACRALLPHLPASPQSHVAVPLWALRELLGEK